MERVGILGDARRMDGVVYDLVHCCHPFIRMENGSSQ